MGLLSGNPDAGAGFGIMAGRLLLLVLVAAGIALRVAGLGWGIPTPLPPDATTSRSSYHLDEDDYLLGVMRMDPQAWNFDVRDYHWGTLQFYLIACALKAARVSGFVTKPCRESFLQWDPTNFARIYIVGRAVSALAGILTLLMVFLIGKTLKNADTGLAAAAFLAVTPLHIVNSHFLTSDVTMILLLLASLYFFMISLETRDFRPRLAAGFLLGLAVSAKYNAAFLLPLWLGRDMIQRKVSAKARILGYGAILAGFAAGEPYALLHPVEIADTLYRANFVKTDPVGRLLLPWPRLLLEQAKAAVHFGLHWTLAVPAVIGLVFCLLRPSRKKTALAAAMVLMAASLVAARWPMLRYALPLLAMAAITAALFLVELPIPQRLRPWATALLCSLPLLASWAQVRILLGEHTANRASRWIQTNVVSGSRIGQIWPEVPPLDSHRYNLRTLHGLFGADPPEPEDLDRDFLILDNLPIVPFSENFLGRLTREYILVSEFRADPQIGPWLWEEHDAPHDWKYTHPTIRIYGRRLVAVGTVAGEARTPNKK